MCGQFDPALGDNMIKFQWEKTAYGFRVWAKKYDALAYVYFGHYSTKKAALDAYDAEQCNY